MSIDRVSVLICTYNRAPRLARTLAWFARRPAPMSYAADILVVDNNSTDRTADVIDMAARQSATPIRRVFEPRQGKAFALNTGLRHARGCILALTDDDVEPEPSWLDRIVEVFRAKAPVFVGGKVLPRWGAPPPSMLLTRRAQDIWGPLALVDYGDEPIAYERATGFRRRPIGANLAIRRDALETVGGWRTDVGRENRSLISGEDHEIFFRLDRAGLYRGWYEPSIVVHHDVPAERLRRRYFRRWFFGSGRGHAMMAADLYPGVDFDRVPRVAGVPRFLYRELAREIAAWIRLRLHPDPLERWIQQLHAIRLMGVMWQSHLLSRSSSRHSIAPASSSSC